MYKAFKNMIDRKGGDLIDLYITKMKNSFALHTAYFNEI